ncbi:MAG: Fic family protein [Nevskia sp.]|nr:Fic family protein [Nevskia sp.]
MQGRYQALGMESEFEPGSRKRVLRNLLGICLATDMKAAESNALLVAQNRVVAQFDVDHRFVAADICELHRTWLGGIYRWAGEYRNVNIAKGDFHFAAAAQIPRLMDELEERQLARHTPCKAGSLNDIAFALAVVHSELVIIHPFREGNGRCARLLCLLMALQAGLPPLDFGALKGGMKRAYIAAIHAAVGSDYEPMRAVFNVVIKRTLRAYQRNARLS